MELSHEREEVFQRAHETLRTAERGLDDLLGDDPTRRMTGLWNVAVFGRSVTFVLQTLRSAVGGETFDRWYLPQVEKMQSDALFVYFRDLRNEILKEGGPAATASIYIEHLELDDLQSLMANPPPGATEFFVGDSLGGSGWVVAMPDGSTEKFYVRLPASVQMETTFHLSRSSY